VAFKLGFGPSAVAELTRLSLDSGEKVHEKAVKKALGQLERDPRHPGLHTHKLAGVRCPHNQDVWQAYAQNNRPGAYRITFCYPPGDLGAILVIDIMHHR
jgi:hypothetical protein